MNQAVGFYESYKRTNKDFLVSKINSESVGKWENIIEIVEKILNPNVNDQNENGDSNGETDECYKSLMLVNKKATYTSEVSECFYNYLSADGKYIDANNLKQKKVESFCALLGNNGLFNHSDDNNGSNLVALYGLKNNILLFYFAVEVCMWAFKDKIEKQQFLEMLKTLNETKDDLLFLSLKSDLMACCATLKRHTKEIEGQKNVLSKYEKYFSQASLEKFIKLISSDDVKNGDALSNELNKIKEKAKANLQVLHSFLNETSLGFDKEILGNDADIIGEQKKQVEKFFDETVNKKDNTNPQATIDFLYDLRFSDPKAFTLLFKNQLADEKLNYGKYEKKYPFIPAKLVKCIDNSIINKKDETEQIGNPERNEASKIKQIKNPDFCLRIWKNYFDKEIASNARFGDEKQSLITYFDKEEIKLKVKADYDEANRKIKYLSLWNDLNVFFNNDGDLIVKSINDLTDRNLSFLEPERCNGNSANIKKIFDDYSIGSMKDFFEDLKSLKELNLDEVETAIANKDNFALQENDFIPEAAKKISQKYGFVWRDKTLWEDGKLNRNKIACRMFINVLGRHILNDENFREEDIFGKRYELYQKYVPSNTKESLPNIIQVVNNIINVITKNEQKELGSSKSSPQVSEAPTGTGEDGSPKSSPQVSENTTETGEKNNKGSAYYAIEIPDIVDSSKLTFGTSIVSAIQNLNPDTLPKNIQAILAKEDSNELWQFVNSFCIPRSERNESKNLYNVFFYMYVWAFAVLIYETVNQSSPKVNFKDLYHDTFLLLCKKKTPGLEKFCYGKRNFYDNEAKDKIKDCFVNNSDENLKMAKEILQNERYIVQKDRYENENKRMQLIKTENVPKEIVFKLNDVDVESLKDQLDSGATLSNNLVDYISDSENMVIRYIALGEHIKKYATDNEAKESLKESLIKTNFDLLRALADETDDKWNDLKNKLKELLGLTDFTVQALKNKKFEDLKNQYGDRFESLLMGRDMNWFNEDNNKNQWEDIGSSLRMLDAIVCFEQNNSSGNQSSDNPAKEFLINNIVKKLLEQSLIETNDETIAAMKRSISVKCVNDVHKIYFSAVYPETHVCDYVKLIHRELNQPQNVMIYYKGKSVIEHPSDAETRKNNLIRYFAEAKNNDKVTNEEIKFVVAENKFGRLNENAKPDDKENAEAQMEILNSISFDEQIPDYVKPYLLQIDGMSQDDDGTLRFNSASLDENMIKLLFWRKAAKDSAEEESNEEDKGSYGSINGLYEMEDNAGFSIDNYIDIHEVEISNYNKDKVVDLIKPFLKDRDVLDKDGNKNKKNDSNNPDSNIDLKMMEVSLFNYAVDEAQKCVKHTCAFDLKTKMKDIMTSVVKRSIVSRIDSAEELFYNMLECVFSNAQKENLGPKDFSLIFASMAEMHFMLRNEDDKRKNVLATNLQKLISYFEIANLWHQNCPTDKNGTKHYDLNNEMKIILTSQVCQLYSDIGFTLDRFKEMMIQKLVESILNGKAEPLLGDDALWISANRRCSVDADNKNASDVEKLGSIIGKIETSFAAANENEAEKEKKIDDVFAYNLIKTLWLSLGGGQENSNSDQQIETNFSLLPNSFVDNNFKGKTVNIKTKAHNVMGEDKNLQKDYVLKNLHAKGFINYADKENYVASVIMGNSDDAKLILTKDNEQALNALKEGFEKVRRIIFKDTNEKEQMLILKNEATFRPKIINYYPEAKKNELLMLTCIDTHRFADTKVKKYELTSANFNIARKYECSSLDYDFTREECVIFCKNDKGIDCSKADENFLWVKHDRKNDLIDAYRINDLKLHNELEEDLKNWKDLEKINEQSYKDLTNMYAEFFCRIEFYSEKNKYLCVDEIADLMKQMFQEELCKLWVGNPSEFKTNCNTLNSHFIKMVDVLKKRLKYNFNYSSRNDIKTVFNDYVDKKIKVEKICGWVNKDFIAELNAEKERLDSDEAFGQKDKNVTDNTMGSLYVNFFDNRDKLLRLKIFTDALKKKKEKPYDSIDAYERISRDRLNNDIDEILAKEERGYEDCKEDLKRILTACYYGFKEYYGDNVPFINQSKKIFNLLFEKAKASATGSEVENMDKFAMQLKFTGDYKWMDYETKETDKASASGDDLYTISYKDANGSHKLVNYEFAKGVIRKLNNANTDLYNKLKNNLTLKELGYGLVPCDEKDGVNSKLEQKEKNKYVFKTNGNEIELDATEVKVLKKLLPPNDVYGETNMTKALSADLEIDAFKIRMFNMFKMYFTTNNTLSADDKAVFFAKLAESIFDLKKSVDENGDNVKDAKKTNVAKLLNDINSKKSKDLSDIQKSIKDIADIAKKVVKVDSEYSDDEKALLKKVIFFAIDNNAILSVDEYDALMTRFDIKYFNNPFIGVASFTGLHLGHPSWLGFNERWWPFGWANDDDVYKYRDIIKWKRDYLKNGSDKAKQKLEEERKLKGLMSNAFEDKEDENDRGEKVPTESMKTKWIKNDKKISAMDIFDPTEGNGKPAEIRTTYLDEIVNDLFPDYSERVKREIVLLLCRRFSFEKYEDFLKYMRNYLTIGLHDITDSWFRKDDAAKIVSGIEYLEDCFEFDAVKFPNNFLKRMELVISKGDKAIIAREAFNMLFLKDNKYMIERDPEFILKCYKQLAVKFYPNLNFLFKISPEKFKELLKFKPKENDPNSYSTEIFEIAEDDHNKYSMRNMDLLYGFLALAELDDNEVNSLNYDGANKIIDRKIRTETNFIAESEDKNNRLGLTGINEDKLLSKLNFVLKSVYDMERLDDILYQNFNERKTAASKTFELSDKVKNANTLADVFKNLMFDVNWDSSTKRSVDEVLFSAFSKSDFEDKSVTIYEFVSLSKWFLYKLKEALSDGKDHKISEIIGITGEDKALSNAELKDKCKTVEKVLERIIYYGEKISGGQEISAQVLKHNAAAFAAVKELKRYERENMVDIKEILDAEKLVEGIAKKYNFPYETCISNLPQGARWMIYRILLQIKAEGNDITNFELVEELLNRCFSNDQQTKNVWNKYDWKLVASAIYQCLIVNENNQEPSKQEFMDQVFGYYNNITHACVYESNEQNEKFNQFYSKVYEEFGPGIENCPILQECFDFVMASAYNSSLKSYKKKNLDDKEKEEKKEESIQESIKQSPIIRALKDELSKACLSSGNFDIKKCDSVKLAELQFAMKFEMRALYLGLHFNHTYKEDEKYETDNEKYLEFARKYNDKVTEFIQKKFCSMFYYRNIKEEKDKKGKVIKREILEHGEEIYESCFDNADIKYELYKDPYETEKLSDNEVKELKGSYKVQLEDESGNISKITRKQLIQDQIKDVLYQPPQAQIKLTAARDAINDVFDNVNKCIQSGDLDISDEQKKDAAMKGMQGTLNNILLSLGLTYMAASTVLTSAIAKYFASMYVFKRDRYWYESNRKKDMANAYMLLNNALTENLKRSGICLEQSTVKTQGQAGPQIRRPRGSGQIRSA